MSKKIGFFNTEFPSSPPFNKTETNCSGGAGYSLRDTVLNIDKDKFKCTIISVGSKNHVQKEKINQNTRLFRYPTLEPFFSNYGSPYKLIPTPQFVFGPSNKQFDLIHCHLGYPGAGLPALYYKYKNGVPLVLSIRGSLNANWGGLKRRIGMETYLNTVMPLLLHKSDMVVVPTEGFISEASILKGYEDEIRVVNNGVDFAAFSKKEASLIKDIPYYQELKEFNQKLLFVGDLVERKGIKTLMAAFESVIDKYPSTCLIIVGSGPLKEFVEKRADKKGYSNKVILTGYVSSQDKLAKLYSCSDLFVFPSKAETFGRVLLESMAAGTPCLVSDIGPLMSVIKKGEVGLHAEVDNPRDFADKIIEFFEMQDEDKRMLEEKSVEYARRHSWSNVARQMEEIYMELLS
ncbi:glycosyltransferase family 4 protein [Methanonatronarchaeum sp. AMET-Sl]|uniref:glycosyltransferase family 4 protein n=1 Tax=Methanonatronarchaeum sp. AMET-Sl TaxID=3037654 RepID=UPI00244E3087|nr:glycosyltransferase family 4 protein [Methanonatronarchaeum sp. AMET-Sl]WGI17650.1 glycosyltransferase family 4 protein [Methanonatronarchaeum sp. AMET-Sl]